MVYVPAIVLACYEIWLNGTYRAARVLVRYAANFSRQSGGLPDIARQLVGKKPIAKRVSVTSCNGFGDFVWSNTLMETLPRNL